MTRVVYLNGDYLNEEDAKISVFDRGFLFADGVYEVTSVLDGKLVDFDGHAVRLNRSVSELEMNEPCTTDELLNINKTLLEKSGLQEGLIYTQVTRGIDLNRKFDYPSPDTPPTLILFTQEKQLIDTPASKTGIKIISIEDQRWDRRDIKTIQLLYPSMAKMEAVKQGAQDAWMIEDGFVTEGTSNNAYIIKGNKVITRPISNDILKGITRTALFKFSQEHNIEIEERPFTIEEAEQADEAFATAATIFVLPVISINGKTLGDGNPGPLTKKILDIYINESRKAAV